MNTAFDILVIGLGALLAIFLILAIFVIVKVKKLVDAVQQLVAKGEQVVNSAEAAAELFKKSAGPIGAFRSLMNIIEMVTKHKGK